MRYELHFLIETIALTSVSFFSCTETRSHYRWKCAATQLGGQLVLGVGESGFVGLIQG